MKFFGRALCALVCLFLFSAVPALAAPKIQRAHDVNEVEGYGWDVEYAQIENPTPAHDKVNAALHQARVDMIMSSTGETLLGLTDIGALNDDVLSVVVTAIDGNDDPKITKKVLNFDLQTGDPLTAGHLFKAESKDRMLNRIATKLMDNGFGVDGIDLEQAEIHPDGIGFSNAENKSVKLSWNELGSDVNFDGALRNLKPSKVDISLGDAPMAPHARYLASLEKNLHALFPRLSSETRALIPLAGRWNNVYDPDSILQEMRSEVGNELADAVIAARAKAEAQNPSDPNALGEEEGALIVDTLAELSQDAAPTSAPMGQQELYLSFLEEQLHLVIPTLSIETKHQIVLEGSWNNIYEPDSIVQAMRAEVGHELADAVQAARRNALSEVPVDRQAFLEDEGDKIVTAVKELASKAGARVIGTDPVVPLLSPLGNGQQVGTLDVGDVVGIETRDLTPEFHRVRLADGTRGLVARNKLLLESAYSASARVYRLADGSYVLAERVVNGEPVGPRILPAEGPDAQDPRFDRLKALVAANGMSPPVYFEGIKREILDRPAWLSVLQFEILESDSPSAGISGHLDD